MLTATTWPLTVPQAHAAPPLPTTARALRLRVRRSSAPHRGVPGTDGAPARLTAGCADTWRVRVRRPAAGRAAGRARTAPHRARVAR